MNQPYFMDSLRIHVYIITSKQGPAKHHVDYSQIPIELDLQKTLKMYP